MTNEQEKIAEKKRFGKKSAGITMFWVGGVVFVAALIIVISLLSDIDNFEEAIVLFIVMVGFGLLTISGVILYFVGKRQEKKQKNQTSS